MSVTCWMQDNNWQGLRGWAPWNLQCESKKSPLRFSEIFPKRLGIFNRFFTHLLCYHFYTRLQIFIHISPTLTKLCHTKCDHLANFYISLELYLLSLLTEQMTSFLMSCHIPHVCWHYKSVYFIVTFHRQRSTKLSTTYANVSTHAFWPTVDILNILCELGSSV